MNLSFSGPATEGSDRAEAQCPGLARAASATSGLG
jgi:hypothetical protein